MSIQRFRCIEAIRCEQHMFLTAVLNHCHLEPGPASLDFERSSIEATRTDLRDDQSGRGTHEPLLTGPTVSALSVTHSSRTPSWFRCSVCIHSKLSSTQPGLSSASSIPDTQRRSDRYDSQLCMPCHVMLLDRIERKPAIQVVHREADWSQNKKATQVVKPQDTT